MPAAPRSVRGGGAAHLAHGHHQRLIEQAPLLQFGQQAENAWSKPGRRCFSKSLLVDGANPNYSRRESPT